MIITEEQISQIEGMKIPIPKRKSLDQQDETRNDTIESVLSILRQSPPDKEMQLKKLDDVFQDLNSGKCIMDNIIKESESHKSPPVIQGNDLTDEILYDMLKQISEWVHQENMFMPLEYLGLLKEFLSGKLNKQPVIQAKEIRDEMDADMEESGMAQGEIESCLNHWSNKYLIIRK